MIRILIITSLILFLQACSSSGSIIELRSAQSMCITGKGVGQDGAINPYANENSVAIVKNVGKNQFDFRIQTKGEIIRIESIMPGQKKEIDLLKGFELYFDSSENAKAKVDFRKK